MFKSLKHTNSHKKDESMHWRWAMACKSSHCDDDDGSTKGGRPLTGFDLVMDSLFHSDLAASSCLNFKYDALSVKEREWWSSQSGYPLSRQSPLRWAPYFSVQAPHLACPSMDVCVSISQWMADSFQFSLSTLSGDKWLAMHYA